MSVRHPTISAWQRDPHDGGYTAQIAGVAVSVSWSRNGRERGGFVWLATAPGEKPHRSEEAFEELESAMADAEEFARGVALRLQGAQPT